LAWLIARTCIGFARTTSATCARRTLAIANRCRSTPAPRDRRARGSRRTAQARRAWCRSVLSDLLCGVGVTDAALVGPRKAPRVQAELESDVGGPSGTGLDESAPEEVVDRLARLLPPDALDDALAGLAPEEITGPGGLITQLAGRAVEAALGAELSEYLGYPPGGAPPGGAANHRNGSTPKTLKTELGGAGPHPARSSGQLRAGRTSSRHEGPRVMQERCWRSGGRCVAGSGRRVRWSPRRG
jgi:hypothetical protein